MKIFLQIKAAEMSKSVQYSIGFFLFVMANASAQGLIPDTDGGRWIVLICTSMTLWLQKMGIDTPTRPEQDQPPPVDPGGGRNSGPNPGGGKPPKQHEPPPLVDPGGG